MSYLIRRTIGPAKPSSPYKDASTKFKDDTIRILFYKLNNFSHCAKLFKELYGFYIARKIDAILPTYVDYPKLAKMASGRFNAWATIYAITDKQLYNDPELKQYKGIQMKDWPKDVILKYAEKNANRFVEAVNAALSNLTSDTYKNLEAVLMNKEHNIVSTPGYGTLWTDVLIKIRYKTIPSIQ